MFQKYSIHDVRFAMNLQETQFLDSVKSIFPVLDGKDFDFLICHGNKLKPLQVEHPTPQKIRFIIRSFTGTVLYIRLKVRHVVPSRSQQETLQGSHFSLSTKLFQEQESVQDDATPSDVPEPAKPPTR